jgi:hypothetical protein
MPDLHVIGQSTARTIDGVENAAGIAKYSADDALLGRCFRRARIGAFFLARGLPPGLSGA